VPEATVNMPVRDESIDPCDDRIRESRRFALRTDVRVRLEADGPEALLRSRNVSAAGLFVEANILLHAGSDLWCTFELPDGVSVEARGRVVRLADGSGDAGMGVEFVGLCPSVRARLQHLGATLASIAR
jgi:hypothetical protein